MAPPPAQYKAVLVELLNYLDSPEPLYTKATNFSREKLLQLTPEEILRWMNFRTFATETPTADQDPTGARSNSIKYWKKALSGMMPLQSEPWSSTCREGNPTRHTSINTLIKYVKKKECRQQGLPSQARRPATQPEFTQLLTTLRESPESGSTSCYGIPAFLCYESSMIA